VEIEEVHWADSGYNFATRWENIDEVIHIAKEWNGHTSTVGYVVYEDEDRIVLAQTLDGERPNAVNAFLIYKPNIMSREVLSGKVAD
jgi:hypothetical protein